MAMSYPLGDLLTRIRNGQRSGKWKVRAPASKLRANVLDVLKREGYIRDYRTEEVGRGLAEVEVELKYNEGAPVIQEIARVYRRGRRVSSKITALPRVSNGLGITLLSTPVVVMSDREERPAIQGGGMR